MWGHGKIECMEFVAEEELWVFNGLGTKGGADNETSLRWLDWECEGLRLWEWCNELLLARLRWSAGQVMLWS